MRASGGEAYFALGIERRLGGGLRSFQGDGSRRGIRPFETFVMGTAYMPDHWPRTRWIKPCQADARDWIRLLT
jgi:hypothetical protein